MKQAIEITEGVTFYPAHEEHGQDIMTHLILTVTAMIKSEDFREVNDLDLESKIWNYSRDLEPENGWINYIQMGHKTYVSITVIDTEVVPKRDKEGFLIKGIVRRAMVDVATQKAGRWYDKVTVVVTPTPKGVRYMSFHNGKPFFGSDNIARACYSTSLSKEYQRKLCSRIFYAFDREVHILDIYPELKYFNQGENHDDDIMARRTFNKMHAMHPFLTKSLGTHSGAKAILNSIYSPTGEKRIQKNAFGGVGEVRDFNRLLSAMLWSRALRLVDPQTLSNVSQTLPLFQDLGYWDSSISDLIRFSDQFDDYLRYFGVGEKPIQTMVTDVIESITKRRDTYLFDAIRTFKQIKSRVVRRAIVDHFRRNNLTMEELHNHINDEFHKMRTENRKISVKKLSDFAGRVSDEIACVVPKETHDLVKWGSEYNICIGSYAGDVLNGQTYCMGFQKPDGTFWGFAEVSREMELKQLLGKHNQSLPNEQRQEIEKYLKTKGVTIPKGYWGSN